MATKYLMASPSDILLVEEGTFLAWEFGSTESMQTVTFTSTLDTTLELPSDVDLYYDLNDDNWQATNYSRSSPEFTVDLPVSSTTTVRAQLRYTNGPVIKEDGNPVDIVTSEVTLA